MITGKYYFRQWAGAEEPQPPPGAAAPAAPYALDFEEKSEKKSLGNTKLAETWSESRGDRCLYTTPAGTRPWDGRDAISCLHRSNWDAQPQHYKTLETTYMSDSCTEELARQHRKLMRSQGMSDGEREARWRKCLAQWEGQVPDDNASRVTGTDFSLLPAGWRPKNCNFRKSAESKVVQGQDQTTSVPVSVPVGRPGSSVPPPNGGRVLRQQAPHSARSSSSCGMRPRAPTPRAATPRETYYNRAPDPRSSASRYSDKASSVSGTGDHVELSPSDLRQVYDGERPNYRRNKLPNGDADPTRLWAPVADVPMNHAR